MTLANTLIGICWFTVVVTWLVTGSAAKTTKLKSEGKAARWMRFCLIGSFLLCFGIDDLRDLNKVHLFLPNYFIQWLSVALCITGASFATWARLVMGKNWAMPMVVQEQVQLITSGPYHFVRHPIYAGLCCAMIGSTLTASILWATWYSLWTLYFLYSALMEEKSMLARMPIEYAAYKEKTKMFIPFVL